MSVGDGLFGKIVIDNEGVFAIVSEEFSDGAAGIGSNELQGSSFGGGGCNDDGVLHGVVASENLDQVGNGGTFLADSDVDAIELFLEVTSFEVLFLVNNGINGNSSFTGLSVTNNQLSLSSADWDQAINGFKTGLHRLID